MSVFERFQQLVGQVLGKPSDKTPDPERRASERATLNERGFVSFPTRPAFPPARCKIVNISTEGARIAFSDVAPDATLLDSGVRLYIERRNHERDCKVIWQKDGAFGLKFTGAPCDPSRAYSALVS